MIQYTCIDCMHLLEHPVDDKVHIPICRHCYNAGARLGCFIVAVAIAGLVLAVAIARSVSG